MLDTKVSCAEEEGNATGYADVVVNSNPQHTVRDRSEKGIDGITANLVHTNDGDARVFCECDNGLLIMYLQLTRFLREIHR